MLPPWSSCPPSSFGNARCTAPFSTSSFSWPSTRSRCSAMDWPSMRWSSGRAARSRAAMRMSAHVPSSCRPSDATSTFGCAPLRRRPAKVRVRMPRGGRSSTPSSSRGGARMPSRAWWSSRWYGVPCQPSCVLRVRSWASIPTVWAPPSPTKPCVRALQTVTRGLDSRCGHPTNAGHPGHGTSTSVVSRGRMRSRAPTRGGRARPPRPRCRSTRRSRPPDTRSRRRSKPRSTAPGTR